MAKFLTNVFVSATSADLKSYRDVVASALLKAKMHPVVQDNFPPDYRSLVDFLEATIKDCDAVICLAGTVYGAAPVQSCEPPRSYTQIEYDVARRLNKKVYVFVARADYMPDSPTIESERERLLQRAHLDALEQAHKYSPFSTPAELKVELLELIPHFPDGKLPPCHVHRPKKLAYFAGRSDELRQLSAAVERLTPCIVMVVGIGGQGKTTLVQHWLTSHFHEEFAGVFWCTAYRGGFTFDLFLDKALEYLMRGEYDSRLLNNVAERASKLLELLQQRPVLMVIDGIERWLTGWNHDHEDSSGIDVSRNRLGSFDGLDDFLSQASAIDNGTHLIITTRALPAVLDNASYAVVPIDEEGRPHELSGLDDGGAVKLLTDMGITGDREQLLAIANRYLNYPLALEVGGGLLVKKYGGRIQFWPKISDRDLKRSLFDLFAEVRQNLPGREKDNRFLQIVAHCLEEPSLVC